MSEKWHYGEGSEYNGSDPQKINPHDLKLESIPEESMCLLCDTQKEYTFPINDIPICLDCWTNVRERSDVGSVAKPLYMFPQKGVCYRCGKPFIEGRKVTSHICTKCTQRAGKIERGRRVQEASQARKVA